VRHHVELGDVAGHWLRELLEATSVVVVVDVDDDDVVVVVGVGPLELAAGSSLSYSSGLALLHSSETMDFESASRGRGESNSATLPASMVKMRSLSMMVLSRCKIVMVVRSLKLARSNF
jgi:hypothetical protein